MTTPDAEQGAAQREEQLVSTLCPEPPLRRYLDGILPGDGPFSVRRITSGLSNELFALERGGGRWVLRRPPRVARVNDMAREYRIVAALADSGVPHARAITLCEDPDVIGAPFFVMEWCDGIRLYDGLPAALDNPADRMRIGEELIDGLAALHTFDYRAAGLGDLGKPDGFTARQVPRWMKQLASYQTRDLPDLTAAAEWLEAHVPETQFPSMMHGDYGLHNTLFAAASPARLLAVVDWETATIGDPLADLGYLLSLWLEGDEPQRWTAVALAYDISGFASRQHLAERYAARTGLDLTDLAWYRAVTQLKVACILEGTYARYRRGDADDPTLGRLEEVVLNHAAYARAITNGTA